MAFSRAPRIDLNPSSADRWTTCTASPKFILDNWDKLPPSDTKFNQEGTTAHEVAAAFLQNREPRASDKWHCPTTIDKEMRMHGWNYMEYVRGLRTDYNTEVLVEQKIPLWYMPERNAIVDAAVLSRDTLHIVDYKYGEGVTVSPVNSLQATIYAKCITAKIGVPTGLPDNFPVTVHIYQPRGRAAIDSPAHTWETTWKEIEEIARRIYFIANGILSNPINLEFAPSEKACQWCPAKGFCSARQATLTREIEVLATIDDSPKQFPQVKAISVKQLSAILKHKSEIIRWLNDAEAYALEHLKAGHKLPGWKLVLSRGGNRYWVDPKKAKAFLLSTMLRRDEVIEEKIITPAQAEKMLGKLPKTLMDVIGKPSGSPAVAPADDKRSEYGAIAENEFENLLEDF